MGVGGCVGGAHPYSKNKKTNVFLEFYSLTKAERRLSELSNNRVRKQNAKRLGYSKNVQALRGRRGFGWLWGALANMEK